ncbi:hypothetical protein SRHO_G00246580 [Serrasalmus rhombeus]
MERGITEESVIFYISSYIAHELTVLFRFSVREHISTDDFSLLQELQNEGSASSCPSDVTPSLCPLNSSEAETQSEVKELN